MELQVDSTLSEWELELELELVEPQCILRSWPSHDAEPIQAFLGQWSSMNDIESTPFPQLDLQ